MRNLVSRISCNLRISLLPCSCQVFNSVCLAVWQGGKTVMLFANFNIRKYICSVQASLRLSLKIQCLFLCFWWCPPFFCACVHIYERILVNLGIKICVKSLVAIHVLYTVQDNGNRNDWTYWVYFNRNTNLVMGKHWSPNFGRFSTIAYSRLKREVETVRGGFLEIIIRIYVWKNSSLGEQA